MIDKFRKDNYLFGALIGIVSTLITAGILLLGLAMFSKDFNDDPKLFMFSFIPAILFMRWYFKIKNIKTAKSMALVIFIGFLLFAFLLFRIGIFSNTHI